MPGTGTVIAAALVGAITLGTLAGAAIPSDMKTATGPDWRETYGAPPAMTGQDYYVEPAPQDLSPLATTSWLEPYEAGGGGDLVRLAPYAYDEDELGGDAAALAVSYDPSVDSVQPAGASANPSADDQAAAAELAAEDVQRAETEVAARPSSAS